MPQDRLVVPAPAPGAQTAPAQGDARELLEWAPVAMLQVAGSGTVCWANAAARAWKGQPVPAIGESLALWLDPAHHELALLGTLARPADLTLASGTRVRVACQPLPAGGWLLVLQPIDEAGAAESQLALAVDLGGIAIWRHDLATQRMHYNAQAYAVLDIPPRPEGLAIDEVRALIHPDDLAQVAASAQAALASDRPTDMEARYLRSDGSWRHVMTRRVVQRDAAGLAIAFVGVALDVTERRSAEQALRGALEQAALAARGAGLGTWEMDLQSDASFWDEQMWVLRGLAPQPQAPSAAERIALLHPDDRARTQQAVQQAIAAGTALHIEFRVIWPDGRVRWLASRSVEVRDAASGTARRIGVNWDVTDSRTAQAVRQEREIALRESAAKSKFLARMSHELRTPLNAVLGFAQLLKTDDAGADPAAATRRRRLEHILAAGQHLLTLINDVLDLASLEGGELRIALQPVALAPLVAATLPLLEPLLHSHRVAVHLGPLELAVMADATRLRQVLLNLLANAVKYNRAGGEVRIEALARGDGVTLRVSDSGRGMSDEQVRHLFEPFNRLGITSDAIEGSGIGLAIVKTLVEHMGGTVHVESRVGSGSVFELRLAAAAALPATIQTAVPAGPEAPASAPPPAPAVPPATAPTRRRQLLYIEDNPVNALIISELLARRSDLALHVAVDGASGVAAALELRPDLILLDMQLPDADGFEVLRRLRADPATAGIPCIALSANAMPEDIERALHAGMADYWTKPLDFKAFTASLDTLFGKAAPP